MPPGFRNASHVPECGSSTRHGRVWEPAGGVSCHQAYSSLLRVPPGGTCGDGQALLSHPAMRTDRAARAEV